MFFFFFKQKTAYEMRISDWSSDVCSSDLCDTLEDAGYTVVGPASTLDEAHELVETAKFDAALLDANLSGEAVDEVAAALTRKGMPFAFVTGYGREALPEAFRHVPLLNNPLLPKSAFRSDAPTSDLQVLLRHPYDVFS